MVFNSKQDESIKTALLIMFLCLGLSLGGCARGQKEQWQIYEKQSQEQLQKTVQQCNKEAEAAEALWGLPERKYQQGPQDELGHQQWLQQQEKLQEQKEFQQAHEQDEKETTYARGAAEAATQPQ